MNRKRVFSSIMLVFLLSLLLIVAGCGGQNEPAPGNEQDEGDDEVAFPEKVIEIIVGAGPGGGSDTFTRAVAQELNDILGVSFNVINMPGGNEAIAIEEVLNRPADGYTFMCTTSTHMTEMALGNRTNPPESLEGLAKFHEDTYAIHVMAGGKYETIEDLVAAAEANPGNIIIAGTYPLSLDELVVRKLEKATGVTFNYIPYDDASQFHADLLGGHVDAIIDEFPPVMELINGEKINPVIVFANDRLEAFPDVPTSAEKGWDITDGMVRGFLIKAGTPAEIKTILEDALRQAYETERYQQFSADRLLNLKEAYGDSAAYDALISKQVGEYKTIYDELQAD